MMSIDEITKKINKIPSGYVGSKKKLIPQIYQCFEEEGIKIKKRGVLDAFCGTGSFSIFAKLSNSNLIVANDFLISSALYTKAFLENPGVYLTEEEIDYLISNENNDRNTLMEDNYVGRDKYFHKKEAIFLDNFRANVRDLEKSEVDKDSTFQEISSFHNNLIHNLNYKQVNALTAILSMISSWFGGGAGKFSSSSYRSREIFTKSRIRAGRKDRPFKGEELVLDCNKYSKNSLEKINRSIKSLKTNSEGKVLNLDTLDLLDSGVLEKSPIEIIYIDLPYGEKHSDYFQLYGLLDSYVLDRPIEEIEHLQDFNYFTSKSNYEESFKELLKWVDKNNFKYWVFSFNDSSWASLNYIIDIIKKYREDISVHNLNHKYKYRSKDNSNGTEHLIFCK